MIIPKGCLNTYVFNKFKAIKDYTHPPKEIETKKKH